MPTISDAPTDDRTMAPNAGDDAKAFAITLHAQENPGIDRLVAGLTHDIRGAMAAIRALAMLAARRVANDDDAGALGLLKRLDAAVVRGSELCDDVLECDHRRHERADAGMDSGLMAGDFDLSDLVREAVATHSGLFEQASCVVELNLPASAPMRGHRRSMERIMANLLRNAAAYGPGRAIEVHVHRSTTGTVVTVRDHGRGITREGLAPILTPFHRSAVEDPSFERFGLGLWIVRNLVGSMGGRLHLASEPGVGTAFSLWLPAAAGADCAP